MRMLQPVIDTPLEFAGQSPVRRHLRFQLRQLRFQFLKRQFLCGWQAKQFDKRSVNIRFVLFIYRNSAV